MQRNKTFPYFSRFRQNARNVTIVSPNGGCRGKKSPKSKKSNISLFWAQNAFLGPKITFRQFLAFWSTFSFLLKMTKMASREPMKHRPGAFWPKSCTFTQKCSKMLKMRQKWGREPYLSLFLPKLTGFWGNMKV